MAIKNLVHEITVKVDVKDGYRLGLEPLMPSCAQKRAEYIEI